MAHRQKRRVDTTTSYDTGIPTFSKIGSMVKKLIVSSQYDFFEGEAFEVTEVILNEPSNRGSVRGSFINNPKQKLLGGSVKPLTPNITAVPLIGEHVVVTEYNGQHYYTGIINRKGSVNENSIPGVAGNYVENTKYGKTFERKNVEHIKINEGDIVFEGRYGHSIKFTSDKQKPVIKLVAGHRGTTENIDSDDSSIYLSGGVGLSDTDSKKIEIKSNDIFITGKRNLYLVGDEVFINAKKVGTIKMGDPRAPMIPTVRGDVMLKFQSDILTLLSDFQQVLILIANPAAFLIKAKLLLDKILRLTDVITKQTFLNKQVVTANPDFKFPEVPKLPKIPEIPKVPNILNAPDITKLGIEEKLNQS